MPTLTNFLRSLILVVLVGFLPAQSQAQNTYLGAVLNSIARPADANIVGISPAGAILRSTDGGTQFTTVRAAETPAALKTIAASSTTVIAIGDSGYFTRSTNSGVAWSALTQATQPSFVGTTFGLASNGSGTWVAVGTGQDSKGNLLRSTNDGVSWAQLTIPDFSGELRSVVWTGTRWIAVGKKDASGITLVSGDGITWTELPATAYPGNALPAPLNSIATDALGNVLVVGDGTFNSNSVILALATGGSTYTDAAGTGAVSETLNAITFIPGTNNWIIAGNQGVVLQYTLNAANPTVLLNPSETAGNLKAITYGTGSTYLYSLPSHGTIGLTAATVSNQLLLTLTGTPTIGLSYKLESSTNLTTWTEVVGSEQIYSGATITWTVALPTAGQKIFYRAVLVTTPLPG